MLNRDVTVLVVDDHRKCREALCDLIAMASGFFLVGEAYAGEDAVVAAWMLSPHVVLMDIDLPDISGVVAARQILRRHPDVLMVLMSIDDPALDPGAGTLGSAIACARKQDLTPARLAAMWEGHQC